MVRSTTVILLLACAPPAATDPVADRVLTLAVQTGRVDLAAFALDNGAQPGARATLLGSPTVLMLAARSGNLDLVELLVGHGAAVNDTDDAGVSALMLAANLARADIVEQLLRAGAPMKDQQALRDGAWNHAQVASASCRASQSPHRDPLIGAAS